MNSKKLKQLSLDNLFEFCAAIREQLENIQNKISIRLQFCSESGNIQLDVLKSRSKSNVNA